MQIKTLTWPDAPAAGFKSYVLSPLATMYSSAKNDTWVTTAMIPPDLDYRSKDNALPALATAPWTNTDEEAVPQYHRWRICKKLRWIRSVGGHRWCSEFRAGVDAFHRQRQQGTFMYSLHDCVTADGRDHFVSKTTSCDGNGAANLRTLGYVADKPTGEFPVKTAPLYRCFDSAAKDHCVDSDMSCSHCGGTVQELLGYGFVIPE